MGSDPERLELDRLRLLLAHASEVITALDRRGVVTYRSPSLERPLGYPDGLIGLNALDIVHPSDRERVRQTLVTISGAARAAATEVFRARHADGSWRWLLATATNLLDEPSVEAIVLSYRDVTEQKRAEQEAEAAKKLASLGTLAAGVGHEINNPLTCLLFTLETAGRLADRCSAGDPANCVKTLRATVAEARDAAQRIAAIVRDLRSLVSEEPAPSASVSLESAIENALAATRDLLDGHAEIRRRYEPVPPVHGIEARLEQLFVNLLANAAHALPKGHPGNTVTIGLRPSSSGGVQVDVEDNGCGIAEENLARIFDPFFSTRRFSGGTGLGLHIAQRIVNSVGGTLSVVSREGAGSTFSVRLRAAAQPAPEDGASVRPLQTLRGTVLVVDDDASVRKALAALLGADHELVAVESAEIALELVLQGHQFDAILCDMLMPGLSGVELHSALSKQSPEHAERIVFVTGALIDPELQAFLERVPNVCLTKPPDRQALSAAIAERVSRSRR
jgi:PAS domain S-box-containing protein